MQTIKYRDPYANVRYGKAVDIVVLDETSPEAIEEVQKYLDGDYRRIKTDDRQYRRNNYSLEGIVYKGSEYGYRKTPEWIYLRKERSEEIQKALSLLTETQLRRFGMFWHDGLSIREIARIEGTDYKSVRESIEAARKKVRSVLDNSYEEEPDFDMHHDKHKYGPDEEDENY